MLLDEWARKWGVSPDALMDLRFRMGVAEQNSRPSKQDKDSEPGYSESHQQALILEAAMNNGVWLTRNNVGALTDERGIPVRYGLANETKARNTVIKSGDLIGVRPVLIGPHHVNTVIGQIVSVECKKEGWKFNPKDKHTAAQNNWAEFLTARGGLAMFANSPESFVNQLRGTRK